MVYSFSMYLFLATKYFESVPPFNLCFFKLKVIIFLYMMKLMSTEISVILAIYQHYILKPCYGNTTCVLSFVRFTVRFFFSFSIK